MAPKDNTGSLQPWPWYKRRANTRMMPAHSILVLLSIAVILLSFAFYVVVDATVPATLDMSLFEVRRPYRSVDGYSPTLKQGTFGYCIDWEYQSAASPSTTQVPLCYRGNGYNTAGINLYFSTYVLDIDYVARLAPALSSLHPLSTVLVFLVLVTTALPCFVPPIFSVALSWLATASSIAAVATTFTLALGTRSRVNSPNVFGYGFGLWALLVAAISTWVFTALLTIAWWLRRRSERRGLGQYGGKSGSGHELPDADASVESQGGELSNEIPPRELHEGEASHKHELLNTDRRERGRSESGAEERYELDTPQKTKF